MGKTKTAFVSGTTEETSSPPADAKAKAGKKASEAKKKPDLPVQEKKVHIAGLKGGQRIKTIDVGPLITEGTEEAIKGTETKREKKPKIRGKKYQNAKAKIDRNKLYPVSEAVKLVKETSYSKFDGAVELHLNTKKADLNVKVSLPHSAGKEKRVEVADEKTIEKLKEGKIDFDVLLATADMMPQLVPFAKVLGPKGLMPNPKSGTLIKDQSEASVIKSSQSVVLKTQKDSPVIHTVVGKVSQAEKELVENIEAIIEAVGVKMIEKVFLKATMGPSIKLLLIHNSQA